MYMFNISITDGSDSLWMNVFGAQGEELLGVPADMVKMMKENSDEGFRQVFVEAMHKVSLY